MRKLLFLLLAPALLYGQMSGSAIEDLLNSTDGESPLPDSLELAAISLLKPDSGLSGSREDLLLLSNRVRFQSSFQCSRGDENRPSWNDTWARTRLTTYSGKRLSSDLLAVRRVGDPRMIDELHLSIAGIHQASNVVFALGTYQFDWGLGILSSGTFGAARSLAYFRTSNVSVGKGVLPRTTSRESSWLRGVALSKEIGRTKLTAFGNFREWNANTLETPANLTGVLNTSSPLSISRRDKVEERSFGGSFEFKSSSVTTGFVAQTSNFDPVIEEADRLNSFSGYGSVNWNNLKATAEIARSGDETAWMAVLSRGTEHWRGAFYAMYAAPEYFSPRSQGAFTFGESFQNSRVIGARIGVTRDNHDFGLDMRSNRSLEGSSESIPVSYSDELIAGWTFNAAANAQLETRAFFANRSDDVRERQSLSLRIEPIWTRLLVWSTRLELRRFDTSNNSESGRGNYLHVQAVRPEGTLRPGVRIAAFDLDDLDSPMQVYEPSVAGAYPLENLSGNGMRMSGWFSLSVGNWDIKTKVSWLNRESGKDSTEFALAFAFRQ